MKKQTVYLKGFGAVVSLLFFAASVHVYAIDVSGQYDVNAIVPFPRSTVAAVIESPTITEVHNAQQIITGTCQISDPNPAYIISIWRGSTVLGSSTCASGSFTIPIILKEGVNALIARTITVTDDYGPDSDVFSMVLVLPIVAQPLPPSSQQPTSALEKVTATNQGSLSGLSVTTEAPFSLMSAENTASVTIIVSGGETPYTMQLNWGDGSLESHSLPGPGAYTYQHTYAAQKAYHVHISVRDSQGAYVEYPYTVVTNHSHSSSGGGNTTAKQPNQTSVPSLWLKIGYVFILLILSFAFLMSYWFGWKRAGRQYAQYIREKSRVSRKRSAAAKKKRKKQKKQKKRS